MNWKERAAVLLSENAPHPLPPKPTKPPLGSLGSTGGGPFQDVKNISHDAAIREHLEERAAIMEYDGGLTRDQAETEAHKALRVFEYRLTDNPDAWLVLIAPGCDLDEARGSLQVRFEKRLIDVKEYRRTE